MVDVSKFNAAVNAYKSATQMGANAGTPALESDAPEKPAFDALVKESLSTAKTTAYKGEAISAKALVGEAELHELVTSVTNAELTLNTVVAIRDRAVAAYQDILKMPI